MQNKHALAIAAFVLAASAAHAQGNATMDELAAVAAKKDPVVWTESSAEGQIRQVIEAFNKDYPNIKVQFVRNTGGNTLAARIIQESQAGRASASLVTGDHQQFELLRQRGLVVERDWTALGVAKTMSPQPHLIATASALGVLVWNKNKVKDAEAPKTYMDLTNPKWAGKAGSWVRAPIYTNLAKIEGDAKVTDFLNKLVANKTRMYASTFPLAQDVASGELDVGFGLYHATMVAVAKGAPVGIAFTDPVPISTIWSSVVNKGANPEGAQVLAAWLASAKGANAYETATGRGNPFVEGSETQKLIGTRKLAEFPLDETPNYIALQTKYNKILAGGQKK